jgi:hypothetical protein
LEYLSVQFKKLLKQLLSLPKTVADPAIYIISGMLLIEAQVDIKILSFYGNVTRQEKVSIEWQLAERQMNFKVLNSNSWFSHGNDNNCISNFLNWTDRYSKHFPEGVTF